PREVSYLALAGAHSARLVRAIYVSAVMLVVVQLHHARCDVGFESRVVVWKVGKHVVRHELILVNSAKERAPEQAASLACCSAAGADEWKGGQCYCGCGLVVPAFGSSVDVSGDVVVSSVGEPGVMPGVVVSGEA